MTLREWSDADSLTGGPILVDAGFGTDTTIPGAGGWRLDTVFVSHAHPDHVATLWTSTDAKIWSPVQRSS
jgi:glyoxylase-like metal-dependent hydrolase (beta-lactamase superfamily II)